MRRCTRQQSTHQPTNISRNTIPRSPSIMAIRPPVLVPPMRSKYSHGFGVSPDPVLHPISSRMSRRIRSDDRPRTPPPSRERILGTWCAGVSSMCFLCCQTLVHGKLCAEDDFKLQPKRKDKVLGHSPILPVTRPSPSYLHLTTTKSIRCISSPTILSPRYISFKGIGAADMGFHVRAAYSYFSHWHLLFALHLYP